MKTIHLPLYAIYYDLIECGKKRAEYRKITPFWQKRICQRYGRNCGATCRGCIIFTPKPYTRVCFRYGYTKRTMLFHLAAIKVGKGRANWGAPSEEDVFIFKLGERI